MVEAASRWMIIHTIYSRHVNYDNRHRNNIERAREGCPERLKWYIIMII